MEVVARRAENVRAAMMLSGIGPQAGEFEDAFGWVAGSIDARREDVPIFVDGSVVRDKVPMDPIGSSRVIGKSFARCGVGLACPYGAKCNATRGITGRILELKGG